MFRVNVVGRTSSGQIVAGVNGSYHCWSEIVERMPVDVVNIVGIIDKKGVNVTIR